MISKHPCTHQYDELLAANSINTCGFIDWM